MSAQLMGDGRTWIICNACNLSFVILSVGFISITRYRDIDRGVGDLAIIVAPRHRTISGMKASLTSALLNSSHRTHSTIIITRTVTGQAPIDGQGATARPRCPTHTITLHKAPLYDLYFAHSHLPYSSRP